jgi:PEP-CTERM/exosortase A-associated glycosyltransferase
MHSGYTFRTRAILKAQIELGWTVAGVTGPRHSAAGPDRETVDGLDFFRTTARPQGRSPLREWREIRLFADNIDAVVRDWKPDVLHAHSPVLNAIAAQRIADRHDLPLIYEIRAFWEDAAVGNGTGREGSARYRVTRALETRAVRRADAVAVICDGLRRDLVARGVDAGKITVSPNGVDLALFGDPPPPDVALAREQGLDDLIAAMPMLVAARPRAHLLMVGGGPMEDSLRAQAEASPAADRIRFVGRVPHQEVERYYGLVDILAYPRKAMRLTELVTPLKPLEAMAQRRLVAASDVGGHRELIENGVTGTLFRPDDPKALADALAGMFADRADWETRRDVARAFVERDRNWSSNISRYLPVYQRLVGRSL